MRNTKPYQRPYITGNQVLDSINSRENPVLTAISYMHELPLSYTNNVAPFINLFYKDEGGSDPDYTEYEDNRYPITASPWFNNMHYTRTLPVLQGITPTHIQRMLTQGEQMDCEGSYTFVARPVPYMHGFSEFNPKNWYSACFLGVTEKQKQHIDVLMQNLFIPVCNGNVSVFANYMGISDVMLEDTPYGRKVRDFAYRNAAYYCAGFELSDEQLTYKRDGDLAPLQITEEMQAYFDMLDDRLKTYKDVQSFARMLFQGIERTVQRLLPRVWRLRKTIDTATIYTDDEWNALMESDTDLIWQYGYVMPRWSVETLRLDAGERFVDRIICANDRFREMFISQNHWHIDGGSNCGLTHTANVEAIIGAINLFQSISRGEMSSHVADLVLGVSGVSANPVTKYALRDAPEVFAYVEQEESSLCREIIKHLSRGFESVGEQFDQQIGRAYQARCQKDDVELMGFLPTFSEVCYNIEHWTSALVRSSQSFAFNHVQEETAQYSFINDFEFVNEDNVVFFGGTALHYFLTSVPSQAFPYFSNEVHRGSTQYSDDVDYGRIEGVEEHGSINIEDLDWMRAEMYFDLPREYCLS